MAASDDLLLREKSSNLSILSLIIHIFERVVALIAKQGQGLITDGWASINDLNSIRGSVHSIFFLLRYMTGVAKTHLQILCHTVTMAINLNRCPTHAAGFLSAEISPFMKKKAIDDNNLPSTSIPP